MVLANGTETGVGAWCCGCMVLAYGTVTAVGTDQLIYGITFGYLCLLWSSQSFTLRLVIVFSISIELTRN